MFAKLVTRVGTGVVQKLQGWVCEDCSEEVGMRRRLRLDFSAGLFCANGIVATLMVLRLLVLQVSGSLSS